MFNVFSLLIICWALATLLPRSSYGWEVARHHGRIAQHRIVYFVLVAILICFSGLRTVMNDTSTYLATYSKVPDSLESIKQIDTTLGANPGFECYRILLRWLGFQNGSVFLFITAIFVTASYVAFLRKHAADFSFSIYLFIASTTFAFTMAAMKQTMAIAIGIWAVDSLIERKRLKFILLMLLAATFHPYVLIYLVAPFFLKEVWSRQTIIAVLAVISIGSVFGQFIDGLISVADTLGDQYDASFFYGSGVNTFRLLAYMVTPALAFIYRRKLNAESSTAISLIINFSIISMCFMILASFGGANMFGRMANYFDVFNCLALPIVLCYGMSRGSAKIVKTGAIACYAFFYYTYYSKYGTSWGVDYYQHISLFDLFGYLSGG